MCIDFGRGNLAPTTKYQIKNYIKPDWDKILAIACNYGHLFIIKLMIKYLIKENIEPNWEEAFYNGCSGGHILIIEFLMKYRIVTYPAGLNMNASVESRTLQSVFGPGSSIRSAGMQSASGITHLYMNGVNGT